MDDTAITLTILIVTILAVLQFMVELYTTAFENVNLNSIKAMVLEDEREDKKRLEKLLVLLENPSKYLYTNKIFSILFTLVIGYMLLGDFAKFIYTKNDIEMPQFVFVIISVVVLLVILTAFCSYLPHKIAMQHTETIALKGASLQYYTCIFFRPIVGIVMLFANICLKIGKQETNVDDEAFSEEDVMSMLEVGQESGAIKEEGKKMINSIFAFDDELAYEIMTPRTDVFMIDVNDPTEEYIDQLMELRYSRIPVYDDDPDNIIGILNIKDYLITARTKGFENVDIRQILRESYFVPETKNIDSLFVELQKTKQQIAILIDEYGGFSGIVTMEDIIEEVMGDIDDEYDQEDHVIKQIGENEYIIDGNVYIDDLNEELGLSIESESSETISGFIIDLLGDLPDENTKKTVVYENLTFLIIKVKERRIEKLKLTVQ